MVEDELRKAAGTEENVDESLAAGPTQQVTPSLYVWTLNCRFKLSRMVKQGLNALSFQKLVTADGTYATQSAFSSTPDKKKGAEVTVLGSSERSTSKG